MNSWQTSRRKLGELTLTKLPLGAIRENASLWFPDGCPERGRVELPINCLHVAGSGCSVLIDACDPGLYPVTGNSHATIRTALDSVGIIADEITHVILTHGHRDHFCGVWDHSKNRPNFPNARHVLSSRDWVGSTLTAKAQAADGYDADAKPLEMAFRLGLIDLDKPRIALPPPITLLDTPGETDGHRVVRISSSGEVFFFLSDLFHLSEEVSNPYLCPVWADAQELQSSRQYVIRIIQASKALSLCSHIPEIIPPDKFHF